MKIGRVAARTDTGRRRLRNEDFFISAPPLFAIADGMGGARAGEIAAGLAAAVFAEGGAETRDAEGMLALIVEANRRIWERALTDPATTGMGTTVTAALVDASGDKVTFGHVGDSRAYRFRDGAIEQVTTDHSLVAELVESGILTPEEAEHHPQRSAITRALGTESTVDADVFTVEVEPGDLFLLCSDGLSDMVGDDEVASLLAEAQGDPERAAEVLVGAANAHGGEDNVTVVLFEIVPDDAVDGRHAATVQDPVQRPEETLQQPVASAPEEIDGTRRRHGAGPGGRVAAILLIAAVLGLAVLALYWGVTR